MVITADIVIFLSKILLDQSCNPVTVNYDGFDITWNETLVGVTVEAPCTGHRLNGQLHYLNKYYVIIVLDLSYVVHRHCA